VKRVFSHNATLFPPLAFFFQRPAASGMKNDTIFYIVAEIFIPWSERISFLLKISLLLASQPSQIFESPSSASAGCVPREHVQHHTEY
jgi:hypothetical protein